jgi:hypothetical protein
MSFLSLSLPFHFSFSLFSLPVRVTWRGRAGIEAFEKRAL